MSLALTVLATAGAPLAQPPATGEQLPEYDVKAAYVFNFAKFVEWPVSAFATGTAPMRLCVFGDDPFGDALASIDGKAVRDRRLLTERVQRLPQLEGCHILFIPRRELRQAADALRRVAALPVLTITEWEGNDAPRGIINLVNRRNRVFFQIAPTVAEQRGLRISSQLLQLAEVVEPPTPEESR